MVDELLQRRRVTNLRFVRQDQLAVIQDVIHVEDLQVTYAGQAAFVCVLQVERKRLLNVFGVKDVLTQDVKCLTADVLTALHQQCVAQQVADMDLLTVQVICTSLFQVLHLQELQECHVQVVTKQTDKDKETTEYSPAVVVLQVLHTTKHVIAGLKEWAAQ